MFVVQDLIKVKSSSYLRYEELLLKKEQLKKEAAKYGFLYEQMFDSLSKEVDAYRLDCVKKRKIISYCRSVLSSGSTIKQKELDDFVEKAIKDYQETLDFLNKDNGNKQSEDDDVITDAEKQKALKTVFRQLAKQIHPDMNIDLKDDETIIDLWNRANIAYNCNNLEELEEIQVLTNRYLQSTNRKYIDVEIEDINERIFNINRSIYKITHTKPYIYKFILESDDSIAKKKDELYKELNDYKRYSEELDEDIKKFEPLIQKND